jgi:hypothetical protein
MLAASAMCCACQTYDWVLFGILSFDSQVLMLQHSSRAAALSCVLSSARRLVLLGVGYGSSHHALHPLWVTAGEVSAGQAATVAFHVCKDSARSAPQVRQINGLSVGDWIAAVLLPACLVMA